MDTWDASSYLLARPECIRLHLQTHKREYFRTEACSLVRETYRVSNEDFFFFLQLKDENSKLRRKLNEVQSFSETQTEMYVNL